MDGFFQNRYEKQSIEVGNGYQRVGCEFILAIL